MIKTSVANNDAGAPSIAAPMPGTRNSIEIKGQGSTYNQLPPPAFYNKYAAA